MSNDKSRHVQFQRDYFNRNCGFFRQPIPEDIAARTEQIVQLSGVNAQSVVLDVGTGTGVLIKHFKDLGVKEANVTGVDLSDEMLAEARKRYPEAQFVQSDFAEFKAPPDSYDAVFFNACFGNIFDQEQVIKHAAHLTRDNGVIVISQPLGNEFMQFLKEQEPDLVLTLMPPRQQLLQWAAASGCLQLSLLQDEPNFYVAILRKTA